jgi:hypothetical protein
MHQQTRAFLMINSPCAGRSSVEYGRVPSAVDRQRNPSNVAPILSVLGHPNRL